MALSACWAPVLTHVDIFNAFSAEWLCYAEFLDGGN